MQLQVIYEISTGSLFSISNASSSPWLANFGCFASQILYIGMYIGYIQQVKTLPSVELGSVLGEFMLLCHECCRIYQLA